MSDDAVQLSDREQEILALVATGATNQQIANELDISINTVKVHLRRIFGKINAASRTEATVYALRHGLVPANVLVPATAEAAGGLASPALETPPGRAPAEPGDGATAAETVERIEVEPRGEVILPSVVREDLAASTRRGARPSATLLGLAALALALVAVAVYLLRERPAEPTAAPAVEANRWRSRAPLSHPRADFAVAAFDDRLYVIGGADGEGPSAAVERYDPITDIWAPLSDKPTPVSQVQAATVGGRIYVPGGEGQDGRVTDIFEAYDPRGERWETLPSLPAPRSRYALAALEGHLYLFGGWDGSEYRGEVFEYDPERRRWEARSPLPTPRRGAGAAVVSGRIYVVGGEGAAGPLRVNESYDPTAEEVGQPWISAVPLPSAIKAPAVTGIANIVLSFDPKARTGVQYTPTTETWSPITVPPETPLSSRVAALSTSVFSFGPPEAKEQAGAVHEYQVIFTTFLPVTP